MEKISVTTTTVSVKTILIGNRQLTQRVFRQILEEDIIDEKSMTLKGIPWGWVHYFWEDSHKGKNEKHVIWLNNNKELRRSYIQLENITKKFDQIFNDFLNAATLSKEGKSALIQTNISVGSDKHVYIVLKQNSTFCIFDKLAFKKLENINSFDTNFKHEKNHMLHYEDSTYIQTKDIIANDPTFKEFYKNRNVLQDQAHLD